MLKTDCGKKMQQITSSTSVSLNYYAVMYHFLPTVKRYIFCSLNFELVTHSQPYCKSAPSKYIWSDFPKKFHVVKGEGVKFEDNL